MTICFAFYSGTVIELTRVICYYTFKFQVVFRTQKSMRESERDAKNSILLMNLNACSVTLLINCSILKSMGGNQNIKSVSIEWFQTEITNSCKFPLNGSKQKLLTRVKIDIDICLLNLEFFKSHHQPK